MHDAAPLSILLLADDQRGAPQTVHDHITAFSRYSRHRVFTLNPRNLDRARFLRFDEFDVVVIHYSVVVIWDDYLSPWFREEIADFGGLKVQFLQDEYRWVDEITSTVRQLEIEVLYSVLDEPARVAVYGERLPGTEILYTLTGFVPESVRPVIPPPLRDRQIDVGYRGRSSPYWLGRLGYEKIEIGKRFLREAAGSSLRCDIAWSEHARIYGDNWYEWIGRCRAMLGSESGASIIDYARLAESAVQQYLAEYPRASYLDVEEAVLQPFAGGVEVKALSPRVFEMAALRTAMIMFPGDYSGVVNAGEHYLPLQKDFSNVDEVIESVKDDRLLEQTAAKAYSELIGSGRYSYRAFVTAFDDDLSRRANPGRTPKRSAFVLARIEQASTGRTYGLSKIYGLVRTSFLAYLGLKEIMTRPPLRALAIMAARGTPGSRSTSLWADVFRIAVLTGVAEGSLLPLSGAFVVVPALEDGVLTLTSRPQGEHAVRAGIAAERVLQAARAGELRQIIWNHAALGQFVTMRIPLTQRQISFDVGHYDAYGVYQFEYLVNVARADPALVVAALGPLISGDQFDLGTTTSEADS